MTPAQKKRHVGSSQAKPSVTQANQDNYDKIPEPVVSAPSDEERRNWQGFCEIESDPAFFNVMLKDFGVKGVKVQEIVSLDEHMLEVLPKPVYGLIFLFRYKPDTLNNQEATCPEHVWFANQTHDYACATVSLLNIVNNIPNVDLGENLQRFKEFTQDLTPAQRGDEIGNFEFVKQIHNSFARKMDMLNIDLIMENQFDDQKKKKKKQSTIPINKKGGKKTSTITEDDYTDEDAAFHFSAYLPIGEDIWKLDGLDRQPQKIGECRPEAWLAQIRPVLENRMTEYVEGQIEFALFSLVKDPLVELRENLAVNIRGIQEVNGKMKEQGTNPAQAEPIGTNVEKNTICGPDKDFHITETMLAEAKVGDRVAEELMYGSGEVLTGLKEQLVNEQGGLRNTIAAEALSAQDDEKRARQRRHDYGPVIYTLLRMLAQKDGVVKDLIQEAKDPRFCT